MKIEIRDDEETKRHEQKRQILSRAVIGHPGTSNTRLIAMAMRGRNIFVYVIK